MVGPEAVPIEGNREELAAALDRKGALFVGLDFDGTLAPIARDPEAPEITPDCRSALEELAAAPAATVAIVSGREIADLRHRVGVDEVLYAGNHGLEMEYEGTRLVHPAAADRRRALDDAVATLEDRLADVPGCVIEDKELTATVHHRQVPRARVDEVRRAVTAVVSAAGEDLDLTRGKAVLEVRPSVDWDKGAAVRTVADTLEKPRRLVYVGDDVTDEDAFRAIDDEGVGVLVGERKGTHADYRLDDQADVALLLTWLASIA